MHYYVNVHEYLIESSKKYPDQCALIVDNRRLSYAALNSQSAQLASHLVSQGLSSGDRVVLCLSDRLFTAIGFWAVLKAGAVCSVINSDVSQEKINEIILDCDAKIFIGDQVEYFSKTKSLDASIFSRLNHSCLENFYYRCLDIDLALIVYTSGSTGKAKGVMMTHRNILSAASSINQYLCYDKEDIILSALPLSFDYGLYQLIMGASAGATLVLEKNFILPLSFMKKIVSEQVTVLPVVPTMITLMSDYAKKFGIQKNRIRCITNTGAALNQRHGIELKKLFPQADIISMYGITECKRCSYLPAVDFDRKPGSVGFAIPNTQFWIVDSAGKPVGPDQVGELVVRGATVMQGYWGNPEATAKRLKPGFFPGEKLLYTGDYCSLDEDGYLYFHGRMDEIFKSKGIKVVPRKIEDVLLSIAQVKEAVVIGIEDQSYGYVAFAFVTLHETIAEQEIQQNIQHKLGDFERPHKIIILSVIPKTAHGKYDRLQLKQMVTVD